MCESSRGGSSPFSRTRRFSIFLFGYKWLKIRILKARRVFILTCFYLFLWFRSQLVANNFLLFRIEFIKYGDGFFFLFGHDVGVYVEGGFVIGVAHEFLDGFYIHAFLKEPCGVGVAYGV